MPSREEIELERRRRQFDEQTNQANARATAANQNYLDRALSFDPSQSVKDYAGAAWGTISDDLKHELGDLKGSSVGAGRLDTGFFDEDQGELVQRALDRWGNAVTGQAAQATGLDLRNIEGLGSYARGERGDALDLTTGAYDRAVADNEARKQRGSWWKRALGTAIGGAAGFALGGPAGAAAGAKAGNSVF